MNNPATTLISTSLSDAANSCRLALPAQQALLWQQAAHEANLHCRQINLEHCQNKTDLLKAFAEEFSLLAEFGENWDALFDRLTDSNFIPSSGLLLSLSGSADFAERQLPHYLTLLQTLDDVIIVWRDDKQPFWVIEITPS